MNHMEQYSFFKSILAKFQYLLGTLKETFCILHLKPWFYDEIERRKDSETAYRDKLFFENVCIWIMFGPSDCIRRQKD